MLRKAMITIVCIGGLSGCQLPIPTLAALQPDQREKSSDTTQRVSLGNGVVDVAAPAGFCENKKMTQATGPNGFAVLEKCKGLFNRYTQADTPEAYLTFGANLVQGFNGAFEPEAMKAFFESDVGKGALARDGDASSVNILSIEHTEDAVLVHARDTSVTALSDTLKDYWRVVTVQQGRLVSLSVIGKDGSGLSDADLKALLNKFLQAQSA